MVTRVTLAVMWLLLTACSNSTTKPTLYTQIGGQQTVTLIVENFIREIEYDPIIIEYFIESDIDRFREKLAEHLCFHTGGPCQYTGDTMKQVHQGMQISETDFNRTVDLLINAMTKAGVSHRHQNQILAIFAPMRKDMIYQ